MSDKEKTDVRVAINSAKPAVKTCVEYCKKRVDAEMAKGSAGSSHAVAAFLQHQKRAEVLATALDNFIKGGERLNTSYPEAIPVKA